MVGTSSSSGSSSKYVPAALEALAQPHVESFDFFIGQGLANLVQNLHHVSVVDPVSKETYQFWISDC